jgi:hypothetical protein
VVLVLLILGVIAAAVAGATQLAYLLLLLGVICVPLWALAGAADRIGARFADATPEQKAEWQAEQEGKMKPLDVPYRSGPGGGISS